MSLLTRFIRFVVRAPNPVKKLEEVRSLIENPDNWTQGTMARNNNNYSVWIDSKDAVRFCLLGALVRVTKDDEKQLEELKKYIRRNIIHKYPYDYSSLVEFNDQLGRQHREIIQILDESIELARIEN